MEDFRDNVPKNMRMHLDDLNITDVKTAARRADDYSVTHKLAENNGSKEGQRGNNPNQMGKRGRFNQRASDESPATRQFSRSSKEERQ